MKGGALWFSSASGGIVPSNPASALLRSHRAQGDRGHLQGFLMVADGQWTLRSGRLKAPFYQPPLPSEGLPPHVELSYRWHSFSQSVHRSHLQDNQCDPLSGSWGGYRYLLWTGGDG